MELPIVTTKLEIGTQEKSEKTLVPVANDQSVLENERKPMEENMTTPIQEGLAILFHS